MKTGRKRRKLVSQSMELVAEELAYDRYVEQERAALEQRAQEGKDEPLTPEDAARAAEKLLAKWRG